MKMSKQFSDYILERTNKVIQFKNSIRKEMSLQERKKYSPIIQSVESIIKEYNKQNEKATEILDTLVEIEELLEEVEYE